MKNNTSYQPSNSQPRHALEFLTIFGISLLFTFAGLSYLKMEPDESVQESKIEMPYASGEQADLPAIGLEKVAEAIVKVLP